MTAPTHPRRLNHVEFAHRPGEGRLVTALFEALGCDWYEVDAPPYGKYIVIRLDDSVHGHNDMFVSQAEPEQLALEDALRAQIEDARTPIATAADGFRELQQSKPFRATHVGLRLPSVGALDEAIERLQSLAVGDLAGRLHLGTPITRSLAEARTTDSPVKQLWIGTDVISTGLLAFGQQIELQAYELQAP